MTKLTNEQIMWKSHINSKAQEALQLANFIEPNITHLHFNDDGQWVFTADDFEYYPFEMSDDLIELTEEASKDVEWPSAHVLSIKP